MYNAKFLFPLSVLSERYCLVNNQIVLCIQMIGYLSEYEQGEAH